MKCLRFLIAPLLLLFAGCGGGGGGASPSAPLPQTAPLGSVNQAHALTEAQSDALQRPQPLYTPGTNDLLYVGNVGNKSITVYHHTAQGDDAPIAVIAGSKTGITAPGQLSEDAQGNLYVENDPDQILTFAHGANGNVKPLRVLNVALPPPVDGHSNTITAMTVDQVTGKIYVAATALPVGLGSVLYRFPPAASGNEAPFASGAISYWPQQLANDSTEKNLIYGNGPACCNSSTDGIQTVVKQFAPGTAPASVYSIGGGDGGHVADDPTTKTYVDGVSNSIVRFAENTVGFLPGVSPPIVSTITGASLANCSGQIALGDLRNIYIVCGNAINVYEHDASGDVAPLRVLSGSGTKLDKPYGIYEGQ